MTDAVTQLTLIAPDDWHLHVRDGDALTRTVVDSARIFGRGLVMPNLVPPVTTIEMADAYRQRILTARPAGSSWQPWMTLYLTDKTPPDVVAAAKASGFMIGFKYYPAGATTHSDAGVTNIKNIDAVLEAMQQHAMPLLIHGEVTNSAVDIFDREKVFIDTVLQPLIKKYPKLRLVLEHITTQEAVEFINAAPDHVGATITVHHLLYDRNILLAGGIRPHYYCLPVLKRRKHQQALVDAATSDNKKYFLGTDSAPHAQTKKENACGCAGIYSAHAALELCAEIFEKADALKRLEGFVSLHGADFYGLPHNSQKVTLMKQPWQVPAQLSFGKEKLVPLRAGEMMQWQAAVLG